MNYKYFESTFLIIVLLPSELLNLVKTQGKVDTSSDASFQDAFQPEMFLSVSAGSLH